MLLLPQRMRSICEFAAGALLASTTACASNPPGGGTETSPTSPTTGLTSPPTSTSPTTGYIPDPEPCDEPKPCDMGADCCEGPVYDDSPCPGVYPNNWTCVNAQCVHGGCTQNSDCTNQLAPGLECRTVGSIGHCVLPCGDHDECEANMPGTLCIGDSQTTNFCLEEVDPP